MGSDEEEEVLGEFKAGWELPRQLPHAVHELYKDGRALTPRLM